MTNIAEILPFLFAAILGFITLNLVFNFLLHFFTKIETLKVSYIYWSIVLATFLLQGPFQDTESGILLSWGLHILPCMLLSKILFDSLGEKFPLKRYLLLVSTGFMATLILSLLDQPFTFAALPICFANCYLLSEPGFRAIFIERQKTTPFQKFLGFVFILSGIHSINFAFFRMLPEAQLIGHGSTLALYQILSVAMLCLSIEENAKTEKSRLQMLVNQRTEELSGALSVKDNLFKVVLHDIANPIQGQLWLMQKTEKGKMLTQEENSKMLRLTLMIREIIQQVRSVEARKKSVMELELTPVNLQQCLDDLYLIFDGQLKHKQIQLVIENNLPPDAHILANKNAFTTSVLCNLVSNAIKFSLPDKVLYIRTYLKDGRVVIEVEDKGIGIPVEMLPNLFDSTLKKSRVGTMGEVGTGFGMNLVKSFIDHFGGSIEVESHPMDLFPQDHGTKFTLTMNSASSH